MLAIIVVIDMTELLCRTGDFTEKQSARIVTTVSTTRRSSHRLIVPLGTACKHMYNNYDVQYGLSKPCTV